MRKIVLAVVVLLAIAGAALVVSQTTNPNRFDSTRWKAAKQADCDIREPMCADLTLRLIGMTQNKVRELLGEPDSEGFGMMGPAKLPDGSERWSYNVGGAGGRLWREFQVNFKNERVTSCEIGTAGGG